MKLPACYARLYSHTSQWFLAVMLHALNCSVISNYRVLCDLHFAQCILHMVLYLTKGYVFEVDLQYVVCCVPDHSADSVSVCLSSIFT